MGRWDAAPLVCRGASCYGVEVARPAPTALTLSPLLLAALAVVLGVIAWRLAAGRLVGERRRGQELAGWRAASALLALLLLAVAYVSPLATLAAHYLLTAHLVQVTLVMGFVPPLLLLGLAPAAATGVEAGAVRSRAARAVDWLTHPALAIALVNVVFFGWHAMPLYQASLANPEVYSVQQVSLLIVSLAFWWPIVKPAGWGRWSMGPLIKLGYILLATIPQTFAGLLFALAHRAFYTDYASATRALGLSPLADQQVAGACMALLSKLALFAAFSVVMWRMLEPAGADGDGDDDGGGGGGRDAPTPVRPGAPAWLRLLDSPRLREEPPARRPHAPVGRR
jgi:cytochrome c oxidase assembly factor CtaG